MERIPPMSKQAKVLFCAAALVLGATSSIALSQPKNAPAPVAASGNAIRVAPAPVAAAPELSAAEIARRSQKVVEIAGGNGVTVGDLEDAMARQSPVLRKRFTDPAELKDLVEKTSRFELLAAEAEKRGYGNKPEVAQTVKQNSVQALMKADFDEEKLAQAVTDAEVKAYYDEHLSEYERPPMMRASQIVVATLEEAKKLLVEAKAADLRAFRTLARQHSIDQATKLRGGDLQYFDPKGKAQPGGEVVVSEAFAKATSALKAVGDVAANPIKVEGGFAIVKLTGERPAISRKLSEVADAIRTRIVRAQRQTAIDAFVAKLQEQVKPELHAERTAAIVLESGDLKGPGVPPGFPHDRMPGNHPQLPRPGSTQPGSMQPPHAPGEAPPEAPEEAAPH